MWIPQIVQPNTLLVVPHKENSLDIFFPTDFLNIWINSIYSMLNHILHKDNQK